MSATVAIVGSVHMEALIRTPRIVLPGERVVGATMTEQPGGKGAIQAVAVSRLGGKVSLVGAIGDDERGAEVKSCLAAEAVDLDCVAVHEVGLTGMSFIQIQDGGQDDGANAVLVADGANGMTSPEDIDRAAVQLAQADVLIVHCELDDAVNLRAIEIAQRSQATVILDACPPELATSEILAAARILVVTEPEGRRLLGKSADDCSELGLARRLASRGPENVVVLLAPEGDSPRAALLFDGEDVVRFDGTGKHKLVDELGSKDACVAAIAVRLAEGGRLRESIQWGLRAAELAAAKGGCIPAMPSRELLESQLPKSLHE